LSAERLAAQPRPKAVGWSGLSGRPIVDSVSPYRRIDFPLGVVVTDMQHEKALQVVLVEVRVQHEEERHVVWTFVGMPRRHHARRIGRLVGCHKNRNPAAF
jgi:hypothetical protein